MSTPLALIVSLTLGQAAPAPDVVRPDESWKSLGPSLWFDAKGRRLIVGARVVLREGALEHLLCRKGTKEHEAILATDAIPERIHFGLILTGAKEGKPVQFVPEFAPPSGDAIAIEMRWRQDGKTHQADARDWVRDERAKASLKIDWVFAGSMRVEDPATGKPVYAADDGDLFTVANFANAILDLPFASTANDAERLYVANTERIPPRGTNVLMILRPRNPTPPSNKP